MMKEGQNSVRFNTLWLCTTALFLAMNVAMSSFGVPVPGGHLYLNDVILFPFVNERVWMMMTMMMMMKCMEKWNRTVTMRMRMKWMRMLCSDPSFGHLSYHRSFPLSFAPMPPPG